MPLLSEVIFKHKVYTRTPKLQFGRTQVWCAHSAPQCSLVPTPNRLKGMSPLHSLPLKVFCDSFSCHVYAKCCFFSCDAAHVKSSHVRKKCEKMNAHATILQVSVYTESCLELQEETGGKSGDRRWKNLKFRYCDHGIDKTSTTSRHMTSCQHHAEPGWLLSCVIKCRLIITRRRISCCCCCYMATITTEMSRYKNITKTVPFQTTNSPSPIDVI